MKKDFLQLLLLMLVSVCFTVNISAQKKAAFLSTHSSLRDLQENGDDDEAEAGYWFVEVYGGSFLPVSEIGTTDLSQFKVIWLAVDRLHGFTNFPEALTEPSVLTALTDYYKAGGNFLLTNHAYKYISLLGRFEDSFEDWSVYEDEGYEEIWNSYMQTFFGRESVTSTVSYWDHPLYEGLTDAIAIFGDEGYNGVAPCNVYPLIAPGWRENHYCYWNSGMEGFDNANFGKYAAMYDAYAVTPLATMDGIGDYFGAPIALWDPQGDYQGKAITIGLGIYEWNQNSEILNPFQHNIERLTENALNVLGGASTGITDAVVSDISLSVKDNHIFVNGDNFQSAKIYNMTGLLTGQFDANQIASGIDVTNLPQGVYLLNLKTANNRDFNLKFTK